ncbi:MAG TPA: hypothetical protein DGB85_09160 [Deltaproteobacteria bacterium]|nr:hypothetical protein [Deltaproteobacteria bacterium]
MATSLANENPAVAQRILRHANISTTISHYVNLPEATSRNLLDQVSQSSSTDSELAPLPSRPYGYWCELILTQYS